MRIQKDDFNQRLEEELGRELRRQLDGQLGRAAPCFLARCVAPPARRTRRWLRIALAAAAAACVAALLVWQQTQPVAEVRRQPRTIVSVSPEASSIAKADNTPARNKPDRVEPTPTTTSHGNDAGEAPSAVGEAANRQPLVLGRALSSRTVDEGTLLVGRTSVRKVRRQWLERVEWFDPQNGARVQRIVPHEEVLFVPLPIN